MADILEWVLQGEITVNEVLQWLQNKTEGLEVPQKLKDVNRLRCEFVPFFLNYLRDQTLPLLQNCKSVTPSPVKTPSVQKVKPDKRSTPETRNPTSTNRVQLFSPVERADASPVYCLDTSQEASPRLPVTPTERNQRTHYEYIPRNKQHKQSPRDNHNRYYQKPAVDPHKSKHKMSLGDFLTSPDVQNSSNKKRKSPLVSVKKDRYKEDGQSPSPGTSRRWNGKKRQPTPDHQSGRGKDRIGDEGVSQRFSLSNSEDFPSIGQTSQNVTTTPVIPVRRINPTPVRPDMKRPQNAAFLDTAGVWGTPPGKDTPGETGRGQVDGRGDAPLVLEMERALLRREKAKRQERTSGSGDSGIPALAAVTPTKHVLQKESSVREPAVAERSEVTHEDRISVLADVYTGCINDNLLPNLNVELYFVVQLLTLQEVSPVEEQPVRDPEDINYFSTIHNAVFFSVLVLEKQISRKLGLYSRNAWGFRVCEVRTCAVALRSEELQTIEASVIGCVKESSVRLLSLLDRSTIRLLSDNPRVVDFSPQLASQLNTLQETAMTKTGPMFPRSPIGGVSFQADTDNRENFPSHQSFLQFKKQRDQFYELIREWEDSHMTPGWQMVEKLGMRVRSLVKTNTELANHIHLARLFQSQLLTMCKGDQCYKTEGDDEQVALLSQLKKSNPEKFKRLQERFVTPMTTAGPCPPQSFPGCQEFFRDFILAASSHSFNQHLTDMFSAKITELDGVELSETDVETEEGRTESVIDEEEKEQFVSSLLAARLVGKFMGFLAFLPYQTLERLPESLLPSYLEIRAKACLPLNVLECVERACCHGHLVMTLPWVVEFLSMMDPLSPMLVYFQTLLSRLLQIYRLAVQKFQRGDAKYNNLLLIFTLGWFFELPALPDGFFFQGFSDIQSSYPSPLHTTKQLDCMDLIDQQVLYTCCPYLVEIRSLLLEFAVGRSNRNTTIRKITPVAADDTPTPTATEKQLQLQMEENFFHNHPTSLKRVVEFVAERTASNYIKKLRSSTLTTAFASAKECVGKLVGSLSGVSPNSRIKEKLSNEVTKEAGLLCEKLRSEVTLTLHTFCRGKITDILPLLLPEEQMEAVVSVSVSISCRQAEERVNQWVNNHITTRVFQRDMSEELVKMCRPVNLQKMIQTLPESTSVKEELVSKEISPHDDTSLGPTDSLTETKVYVRNVILYSQIPTAEDLSSCVQRASDTLTSRQDLLPEGYRSFSQMLQDLALFILCSRPQLWTDLLCTRCLALWTGELREQVQFGSLFSPRLLHWIKKSTDAQGSWRGLAAFVLSLLKKGVVTSTQIQTSAVQLLHVSLQMGMFHELGSLLLNILKTLGQGSGRSYVELEEWSELIDTLHTLSRDHTDLRHQLDEWTNSVGVSGGNTSGAPQTAGVTRTVDSQTKSCVSTIDPSIQVENHTKTCVGTIDPSPQLENHTKTFVGTIDPSPQLENQTKSCVSTIDPSIQVENHSKTCVSTIDPSIQVENHTKTCVGTIDPSPQLENHTKTFVGTIDPSPQLENQTKSCVSTIDPSIQVENHSKTCVSTIDPSIQVENHTKTCVGTIDPSPQLENQTKTFVGTIDPSPQLENQTKSCVSTIDPSIQVENHSKTCVSTIDPSIQVENHTKTCVGTIDPSPQLENQTKTFVGTIDPSPQLENHTKTFVGTIDPSVIMVTGNDQFECKALVQPDNTELITDVPEKATINPVTSLTLANQRLEEHFTGLTIAPQPGEELAIHTLSPVTNNFTPVSPISLPAFSVTSHTLEPVLDT